MPCWILGYLLVGFALEWVAIVVFKVKSESDWKKELAMVIFWPAPLIIGLLVAAANRAAHKR